MTIDELCAEMKATIDKRIADAVAIERERCAKMKLTKKQIDAIYKSNIGCIRNHDVSVEDLQKIWDILSDVARKALANEQDK